MRWLLLAALVAGCSHRKPYRDSPQYAACRISCEQDGDKVGAVVEDDDSIVCVCKKPPPDAT